MEQPRTDPSRGQGARDRRTPISPAELVAWLVAHVEEIVERWSLEIRARNSDLEPPLTDLVDDFVGLIVGMLPQAMGPLRDSVRPLFQQSAELYGNLGALRGLAAGEAVEEMQLLREVLLRFLYTDPPRHGDGGIPGAIGLRELLQLNRLIDEGVTFASVGHTDTLFFSLLHGSGVAGEPEASVLEELGHQVRGLSDEADQMRSHPPGETGTSP